MATTDKLTALGRAIADLGDEAVVARERPDLGARVTALREAQRRREGARNDASLRWPVAIGAALGAVASVLLLWGPAGPLTFAVGSPVAMGDASPATLPTRAGELGAWVVAPPAQTVPIGFSDGTRVRLEGGARVRVLAASAHGARVAIERGAVQADVVPRSGNDWWVVGGPFEIHVTGTSFEAGWDPEGEVLRVSMREGRVVVRAACLDHERALVAGESASLSCAAPRDPGKASTLAPASPAGTTSAAARPLRFASTATPSGIPADAVAPSPEPEASASSTPPPASWRDLARRADYKGALAAAEAEGWGGLCESLSAADLLELGTTARLAGRSARAMEAYSAVRRRFGGSDAAAVSAFHLGQMAFDGARALADAHRWFTTYLSERPFGALAAEALGRAMEAEQRLGDLAQARDTARKYLARYPTGAHAEIAKSLLAP